MIGLGYCDVFLGGKICSLKGVSLENSFLEGTDSYFYNFITLVNNYITFKHLFLISALDQVHLLLFHYYKNISVHTDYVKENKE